MVVELDRMHFDRSFRWANAIQPADSPHKAAHSSAEVVPINVASASLDLGLNPSSKWYCD